MYNKVVQLLDEYIPDMADERIMDEYSMSVGEFIYNVADYVTEDCVRSEDYIWLKDTLRCAVGDTPEEYDKHITCHYAETVDSEDVKKVGAADKVFNRAYFIFHPTYKKAYFKAKFERFKTLANELTLKEFMSSSIVNDMKQALNKKYDLYVTDVYMDYCTLDEFCRDYLHEDKENKFWLGSTLDYHF